MEIVMGTWRCTDSNKAHFNEIYRISQTYVTQKKTDINGKIIVMHKIIT